MVDRAASPAALQQRLLRRFALLAFGFWRGPTRIKAWGFTIGLFLALLLNLAVAVAVNGWNKLFFDALQYKNEQRLVFSIFLVLVLAGLSALTVALLQQVRMRLQCTHAARTTVYLDVYPFWRLAFYMFVFQAA